MDWGITISAIALLVSLYSVLTARKAIRVNAYSVLRVTDMFFNDSDNFFVNLHNTGPGVAHDVRVIAFERIGFQNKGSKGIWQEQKILVASGRQDIPPNDSEQFKFNNLNPFNLQHKRPIIISWRLANNKRYTSYYKFQMGAGSREKVHSMTKREILSYKLFKHSDKVSGT